MWILFLRRNDINTRQFGNTEDSSQVAGNSENKRKIRVKDNEYHKEKMMLSKQESKGILFSAKQNEWLPDTDEEPDEQELEAHYMCMAKI
ncbi:hypothetical protein Tco_0161741 [Tanacetum coccineum]